MSEQRKIFSIKAALTILLAGLLLFFLLSGPSTGESYQLDSAAQGQSAVSSVFQSFVSCNFFDNRSFLSSLTRLAEKTENGEALFSGKTRPLAGVIPHHLIAGEYIADFFAACSAYDYDTVVLIGPNHSGQRGEMILSDCGWQTPFGALNSDGELNSLLSGYFGLKTVTDAAFTEQEWSVAGLIPYVGYYLPEARVSTVLFSASANLAQAFSLAELLAGLDKNILVVFSIDFSHYLSAEQAELKDRETIQAVEAADFAAIARIDRKSVV